MVQSQAEMTGPAQKEKAISLTGTTKVALFMHAHTDTLTESDNLGCLGSFLANSPAVPTYLLHGYQHTAER